MIAHAKVVHNGIQINTVKKMDNACEAHTDLARKLVQLRSSNDIAKMNDIHALQDISLDFIGILTHLRADNIDIHDHVHKIYAKYGQFGLMEVAYNLIMSGNCKDFDILVKFIRSIASNMHNSCKSFARFVKETIISSKNVRLITSFVCEFYPDIRLDKVVVENVLALFEMFTSSGHNFEYAKKIIGVLDTEYVNSYVFRTKAKVSHFRTLMFMELRNRLENPKYEKVLDIL